MGRLLSDFKSAQNSKDNWAAYRVHVGCGTFPQHSAVFLCKRLNMRVSLCERILLCILFAFCFTSAMKYKRSTTL